MKSLHVTFFGRVQRSRRRRHRAARVRLWTDPDLAQVLKVEPRSTAKDRGASKQHLKRLGVTLFFPDALHGGPILRAGSR